MQLIIRLNCKSKLRTTLGCKPPLYFFRNITVVVTLIHSLLDVLGWKVPLSFDIIELKKGEMVTFS